jgi:hypothetical protein
MLWQVADLLVEKQAESDMALLALGERIRLR